MRVITLDSNKKIISVKNVDEDYVLESNDIISEIGDIGQVQQEDGTFITPEPTPTQPQTTLEDKINYIYYKEMGVIA